MIQQAWQKQELKQHLSSSQRQVDLFLLHDVSAFPSILSPFHSWNWLTSCDSIQESFLLTNTLSFKASLALSLHHDLTAWVLPTKCLTLSFSKIQFCEGWVAQIFFSRQTTGYSMNGFSLSQIVSTDPNSWALGNFIYVAEGGFQEQQK